MKQFTIELNEKAYKWIAHIAEVTGKPEETDCQWGVWSNQQG